MKILAASRIRGSFTLNARSRLLAFTLDIDSISALVGFGPKVGGPSYHREFTWYLRPEKAIPALKQMGFSPIDRIEGEPPGEVATMYYKDWGAKVDRRSVMIKEIKG